MSSSGDQKMEEKSSSAEVVDLTDSPANKDGGGKVKKLKQMRLPFAPIQKDLQVKENKAKTASEKPEKSEKTTSDDNGSSNKRKRSQNDDDAPNKVIVADDEAKDENSGEKESSSPKENKVQEQEKRTPRRIQPTFLGKSPASSSSSSPSTTAGEASKKEDPKAKKQLGLNSPDKPAGAEASTTKTPTTPTLPKPSTPSSATAMSPLVREEKKFKLKVAAAKLSVAINELNDSMQKAADGKDFLKAAEIKEKLDAKEKEKSELEEVIKSEDGDRMQRALLNLSTPVEKLETTPTAKVSAIQARSPSSSGRKRSVKIVSTPGSQSSSESSGTPDSSVKKPRKLTPKQEKRLEELQKKREEKDKAKEEAKLERERKKEEEKQKKEEARLEKEREKERLKKEKEAQKEAERQEKAAQKKKREEEKELEKKMKAEELQKKQEEKEKKQEEKERQLEEKRRQEQAEKEKAEKEKLNFKNFFLKKTTPEKPAAPKESDNANSYFTQFRIKKDMRIAPLHRHTIEKKNIAALDADLKESTVAKDKLYIGLLKSGQHAPGKFGKTWALKRTEDDDDDDDVEIIEEEDIEDEADAALEKETREIVGSGMQDEEELKKCSKRIRAKLLQFSENERPPYWGTWTKTSAKVSGRRPFTKDEHFFDYDYDSGDDWEEEEQGESLSDEEKDKEEDEEQDDEDDDDGFFVGHGVLDKEEMNREDSDEEGEVEFDEELEHKKQRLRAQEFEEQYKKKKPVKLKQKVWCTLEKTGTVHEQLLKILAPFAAVNLLDESGDGQFKAPIPTTLSAPKVSPAAESVVNTPGGGNDSATPVSGAKAKKEKVEFPEDSMKDLIRLVHANTNNKLFMVKEFVAFLSKKNPQEESKDGDDKGAADKDTTVTEQPVGTPKSSVVEPRCNVPKRKILDRILEIADYKKFEKEGPMLGKVCWVVREAVLQEHEMADEVKVPNDWEYILEKPKRASLTPATAQPSSSTSVTPKRTADNPSGGASDQNSPTSSSKPKEKKRVSIQTLFKSMNEKKEATATVATPKEPSKNNDESKKDPQ